MEGKFPINRTPGDAARFNDGTSPGMAHCFLALLSHRRSPMSKAPGHEKWPNHIVEEAHVHQRVRVQVENDVIADSTDVIRVNEDRAPLRYYFPRSDIRMDQLQRTATTTECPFKGVANYFSIQVGERTLQDAAWSYEDPYEEHADLKGRIAFYDDKLPAIKVSLG
jgi:uncharacterized protein (DUF427 family)